MISLLKMMFVLLKSLVYDWHDNLGIRTKRFNAYKFMGLVMVVISLLSNVWLISRYVVISNAVFELQLVIATNCPRMLPEHYKRPEKKP